MIAGQVIGPFEIVRELGSGAMGAVYLARYTRTDVLVAIKLMTPSLGANERALARFEREADVLKQLRHPNIVRLLATGKYKKAPFYAMEYVEGENLDQALQRRQRFAWEDVVEIGKQVCSALQHAHAAGIIHRDLKPSNLMLTEDGTVKLTDFGIAKDLDVTQLTTANHTVGTASYMSPEQCKGERDLTNKSDLYSLGVVFYELLTGRKPFLADNVMDMFLMHVKGRFERPSRLVFDIPVWLDTLVCQLLEKKPEHRPRDAAMVEEILSEVREKAETLQSAGVEAATRVVRKGVDERDKTAARALLAARRKKKKSSSWGAKSKERLFTAAGLAVILAAIVGLTAYLLWPNPQRDLQELSKEYEKWEMLMNEGSFEDALAHAYDLDLKLQKLVHRFEGEVREEARRMRDSIEAGGLYIKVQRMVRDQSWESIRRKHGSDFDDVYSRLLQPPFRSSRYAEKARILVQPLEAPALLKEGRELAAKPPEEWPQVRERLGRLLDRYPDSTEAATARRILDRLTAREMDAALREEMERRRKEGLRFQGLSQAMITAIQAVEAEEAGNHDEAKKRWNELLEQEISGEDEQRLILLARYKLGRLDD